MYVRTNKNGTKSVHINESSSTKNKEGQKQGFLYELSGNMS